MTHFVARGAGARKASQKSDIRQGLSTLATESNLAHSDQPNSGRRDFIYVATAAVGVVGVGAVAWPLINQMNPDASVLALASTEFDVSSVEEGSTVTIKWRGSPVFVRHRTQAEIDEARAVPMGDLKDPQADQDRQDSAARGRLCRSGRQAHRDVVTEHPATAHFRPLTRASRRGACALLGPRAT